MSQAATPFPLALEVVPALRLLVRAALYAEDAGGDPWQFAVESRELRAAGASRNDLRWLLTKGLAAQAHETTVPGDPARTFRPLPSTAATTTTCLQLTPSGVSQLRGLLNLHNASPTPVPTPEPAPSRTVTPPPDLPHWDPDRRELRFRGTVVKHFRVPAANQELLLSAFQEEGWPHHIDDPLIPAPDQEPKRRLLATIKSLNRNQIAPLLRFHGNGNGLQVYWEPIDAVRHAPPRHVVSPRP